MSGVIVIETHTHTHTHTQSQLKKLINTTDTVKKQQLRHTQLQWLLHLQR